MRGASPSDASISSAVIPSSLSARLESWSSKLMLSRKLPSPRSAIKATASSEILIFSSQDEELYAMRYLKMGAGGYLSKQSSPEIVKAAVTAMLDKGRYFSDNVKEAMFLESLTGATKDSPFEALSDRELQIANKLAEGLPLKEISNQLNIHSSTVSTYKNRLFEKLKIRSVPELVEILRLYNK